MRALGLLLAFMFLLGWLLLWIDSLEKHKRCRQLYYSRWARDEEKPQAQTVDARN